MITIFNGTNNKNLCASLFCLNGNYNALPTKTAARLCATHQVHHFSSLLNAHLNGQCPAQKKKRKKTDKPTLCSSLSSLFRQAATVTNLPTTRPRRIQPPECPRRRSSWHARGQPNARRRRWGHLRRNNFNFRRRRRPRRRRRHELVRRSCSRSGGGVEGGGICRRPGASGAYAA
jgi:hypothetical protein